MAASPPPRGPSDAAPTAELPAEALALLEEAGSLGVPVPAYGGRSVPNVTATVVAALGHDLGGTHLPPLAADLDPFRGGRAEGPVVLVLVDGLGYPSLRAAGRAGSGPVAAAWARAARPITTVFPSGTAVALASLSSAAAPAQHGVVGHRQYLPRFGAVVEVLRMSPLGVAAPDALVGPGWSPSDVLGVPTVFRRGVPAVALSRDRFEGTGFTRMIYDGAGYAAYATFADLAFELRRLLGRTDPPPFLLVYWDELDLALHLKGPLDEITGFEVDRLGSLLAWVARGLPPERARATTVLLTADHGLVPANAPDQVHVDRVPELAERLGRPPAGDRRATFFRARSGEEEPLRAALLAHLGSRAIVLRTEEALGAGLFGPPPYHPELADRLGDLVVLPRAPAGLGYTLPGHPPPRRTLQGAHGGLAPEELLVPLLAGPLDRLADPDAARPDPRPGGSLTKR